MVLQPLVFNSSSNLDSLPQIKSTNLQVNIKPFWGDKDQCIVGITRVDWNVRRTYTPQRLFSLEGHFIDGDQIGKNRERLWQEMSMGCRHQIDVKSRFWEHMDR